MRNGYLRVAAVSPKVNVADIEANVNEIIRLSEQLEKAGVEIAVFPEMCITGYTCGDLFHNHTLIDAAAEGLRQLAEWSLGRNIKIIVGYPKICGGRMYNCATVISPEYAEQEVKKTYIPNYNEFYERRWWRGMPAHETAPLFEHAGVTFGIEICEDLWAPIPPSSHLALAGAEVVFNLSASNDLVGKYDYLRSLILRQSGSCLCGYVYAGAGFGESSTDLVFDGKAMIAENGSMLAEKARWAADGAPFAIADIDIMALRHDRAHLTTFGDCAERENMPEASARQQAADKYDPEFVPHFRTINPWPFVPSEGDAGRERCEEILNIQSTGLARRLDFIKCRNAVVGISGGLDSTLALLVCVRAFDRLGLDRKGITGITMPGFGTTGRTRSNAVSLMEGLGVSSLEIPIGDAVSLHFRDIGHDPQIRDITYENSQARERTQILMDVANRLGGIVIGTGDLSELALGWATYNGDHMSMYGVNTGVPKTLVGRLVRHEANRDAMAAVSGILADILDTPVSPELIPATDNDEISQRTEDLVGPYELHDFFLYQMIRFGFGPKRIHAMACRAFEGRYDSPIILHWLRTFCRRFFTQQFKRSCLPDGPKVGSICLSPRGDWRMPSDASCALWIKELDTISVPESAK